MSTFHRDPELDDLVAQLNRVAPPEEGSTAADRSAATPAPARRLPPPRRVEVEVGEALEGLLVEMVRQGASDLLLVPGEPPVLRLDGRLVKSTAEALGDDDVRRLFLPYLGQRSEAQIADKGAADFSIRLAPGRGIRDDGGWRFRVNLHRQRGRLAAAVRALPRQLPTLASLNLPPQLAEVVSASRGLVLVCGPTGAGKSSTLAALVGEINRRRAAHVLTIEDPVEYELTDQEALIEQVEVGTDAPSFADALRAALRQDPDVILVGEMRDLDTMATALTAAETGHLILSTLHTNDVAQAVHRIVDVFPPAQQTHIRHQLALSLNAIVCQQLVPCLDRPGRVPAVELLLATYAVRNHIRNDKLQNLYTEITLGKRHGMVSMEASLAELVQRGVVDYEEAAMRASRLDELNSLLGRG